MILGAITGIGGGMLRDVLLREIPGVLRGGLYAIPALIGAAIVVSASRLGAHGVTFPIVAAAICFAVRLAGIHFDLNLPPEPTRAWAAQQRRRTSGHDHRVGTEPPRYHAGHPPKEPPIFVPQPPDRRASPDSLRRTPLPARGSEERGRSFPSPRLRTLKALSRR